MFRKFLKAFGSFFDMGAANYDFPKIKTVAEAFRADKRKLAGDWKKVGNDMYKVMRESMGEEEFEKITKETQ